MDRSKNTGFGDRLSAAADAKKAQLERAAQARSAAESPAAVERRMARDAVKVARDARIAERRVNGAVRDPLALSYRDLREMPSETRTATLECAGNGRVFLVPQVRGAQWELGAVGQAEWAGGPLRALLERAG